MMQDESVYLVVDYDGFKIVANGGGAQWVIAGPCNTVDEALRKAFLTRNSQPVAIKLESC